MFNKKKINKLEGRISELEKELWVDNYFAGCPGEPKRVLKREAVSFQKRVDSSSANFDEDSGWIMVSDYGVEIFYTTKKGYENHKSLIEKWEKEDVPQELETKRKCLICGAELPKYKHKFCSDKCYKKHRKLYYAKKRKKS